MVASITTYMVIFIQFMPKEEAGTPLVVETDTAMKPSLWNETNT